MINIMNSIPRMRTISNVIKEIKNIDPNTAFTERALRRMINEKEIPVVKIGNKNLINLDLLIDKLTFNSYNDKVIGVS